MIFIDELDAMGRGFDPRESIVLLVATNRPEILIRALLRAGCFDRQVVVDRPDRLGRAAIVRARVKGIKLAKDVDLNVVASLTPGFKGGDLASLVNEAALRATRRDADARCES